MDLFQRKPVTILLFVTIQVPVLILLIPSPSSLETLSKIVFSVPTWRSSLSLIRWKTGMNIWLNLDNIWLLSPGILAVLITRSMKSMSLFPPSISRTLQWRTETWSSSPSPSSHRRIIWEMSWDTSCWRKLLPRLGSVTLKELLTGSHSGSLKVSLHSLPDKRSNRSTTTITKPTTLSVTKVTSDMWMSCR